MRTHQGMRSLTTRFSAAAAAIVLVLTGSGCTSAPSEHDELRASAITIAKLPGLGDVLVDGEGFVLYVFEPDAAQTVTCTFTCANRWPPLRAIDGGTPTAGDGIDASLISTLPNPAGGEVITYNGWPLYGYTADTSPGDARGQDTYLNGGVWYVMQPDGQPLIP